MKYKWGLAAAGVYFISAFWPVKNAVINSTFGETRYGYFHKGLDMLGAQPIHSFDSGRVIFQWSRRFFPEKNYPGSGNMIVVAHAKSLRSSYYHLHDTTPHHKPGPVTGNSIIAVMGNTGHSLGSHLHFMVEDMTLDQIVNPLFFLEGRGSAHPPEFVGSPGVSGVYVQKQGRLFNLKLNHETDSRFLDLVVDAADRYEHYSRGIYRLEFFLNGKLKRRLVFDKISRKSNWMTIGGNSFDDIFAKNRYYRLGEIKVDAPKELEVRLYNFSGQSASQKFKVSKIQ